MEAAVELLWLSEDTMEDAGNELELTSDVILRTRHWSMDIGNRS